jgi:type IV secretory pathway TrbD component
MSILGDAYQRVVKLAVEEFIELIGYFLWMVGTIDYAFQARAIAFRDPQSAARKRRDKRRHDSEGRF